jgi:hypothetical protein
MTATKPLEEQHRKVTGLLARLEAATQLDAPALLAELADDLAAHLAVEQQAFYPAVCGVRFELPNESYEEQALVEIALKRLLRTPPDHLLFGVRVAVLKELVEDHIGQEEPLLFAEVESAMDSGTFEALKARLGDDADFAHTSADDFEEALVPVTPRGEAYATIR